MGCLEDDIDYGLRLMREREDVRGPYADIQFELHRGYRFGFEKTFNSAHEAYAVILEELDEFWELVRQKRSDRDPQEIKKELVQIGAMVIKALQSIGNMTGGKC